MPRLLPSVALALLMAGCTQFPEIDARVPEAERNAPPPRLIPLAPLLARADAATLQSRVSPEAGAPLEARAATLSERPVPTATARTPDAAARLAALSARAEALREGAVIAQDTRARMDAGVTLPAALQ